MADFNITDTVDITDVVCPVTFVKAKVALEELEDGDILAIHLNDGEPVQNVPRSIKEEGHKIRLRPEKQHCLKTERQCCSLFYILLELCVSSVSTIDSAVIFGDTSGR